MSHFEYKGTHIIIEHFTHIIVMRSTNLRTVQVTLKTRNAQLHDSLSFLVSSGFRLEGAYTPGPGYRWFIRSFVVLS